MAFCGTRAHGVTEVLDPAPAGVASRQRRRGRENAGKAAAGRGQPPASRQLRGNRVCCVSGAREMLGGASICIDRLID